MEKFDKNYITGFVLLFLMYGTYMYFYSPPAETPENAPVENTQSVVSTTSPEVVAANTIVIEPDTALLKAQYGNFASAVTGDNVDVILENAELKVTISSKGGTIKRVELKNHRTYNDFLNENETPMVLIDEQSSKIDLEVKTPSGIINLSNLYFTAVSNSNTVTMTLALGEGKSVKQVYTLPAEGYALDYDLQFDGTAGLINNEPVSFKWNNKLKQLEKDLSENRKATQINFQEIDEDFEDYGYQSEGDDIEQAEDPVNWFSFKQKYFTTGLASKNEPFTNMALSLLTPTTDSSFVKDGTITAQIPFGSISNGTANFRYYFGPNEMKDLETVAEGFQQNLYLGYDIIKPINKYIFVPTFNFLEQFFTNYGILILVLVFLLKLVLSPLLYKSYTSSAKMRVLAPEIAEIKERVGDDSVKVQQETMKLYQQVGVSPMSGCIPMVLQMPILMSVFFLFPNMAMFRQKGFLWANDLSTYDAPISWGTSLPIIGDHLSLFVVLMTISSLAFTYYNNQITPSQPGPVDMKKISYIFPLVFFFVLNSFPAALSFYYLVSNLVTIGQQLIIKKFIDEDKIKAQLAENKVKIAAKPKKKNKFANYMQKQLEAQEQANKTKAADLKKRKAQNKKRK